jgi:hypothetical protein
MPTPYLTLVAPFINARSQGSDLTQLSAAAIAMPRGLLFAPVSRTTQLLGCTETYLTPLSATIVIPAAYGNRNLLVIATVQGVCSVGDYVQFWANKASGGSLPALGGANRLRALNVAATSVGGATSGYGVLRWLDLAVAPGTYTYSLSGLAVGANCATGGPFANGTTDKMWFAIEDRGAA